jgi:hypothetical protein
MKDSFYEELECVFDKFPKIPYEMFVRKFRAKIGWEEIFKQRIGNGLHIFINLQRK